jgi:ABC-2 type transport system permease protein
MRALLAIYRQQFKSTLAMMFQYRASLLIWMIGQVLEPLIMLVVWSVVSETGGGSVGDYTAAKFASYFLLLMLVNHVTYTWIMHEFEYRIREGIFSFALLKPVHPIHSDIADNISSKLITMPVMIIIAAVLAVVFHASIAPTAWAAAVFVPALLLAFVVRFLLEWTLAQAAFWTTRVGAINQTYFVLLLFLSGQIAPLELLPFPAQIAARVLPFYWVVGFPVELLLGQLTPSDALIGIGALASWLGISLVLVRVVWKAGLRVYSAVGA